MATPGEETPASPAEAPATGDLQLTPEEINLIKARRATREGSPTKKSKQEERPTTEEWKQFLEALSAKNFELGDLDPQLCNLLKTSKEARDDFLALNLLSDDTQHFDQQTGTLQKLSLSKKRPFEATLPTLEVQEQNIEEAMRQYHQSTVLPSFQVLWDACKQFYANTSLENHFSQMRLDMQDSRLTTLEARLGRRSVLLKGLPAWGVRKSPWTTTFTIGANKQDLIHHVLLLWPATLWTETMPYLDWNLWQKLSVIHLLSIAKEWNVNSKSTTRDTRCAPSQTLHHQTELPSSHFMHYWKFSEISSLQVKKDGMENLMQTSTHCRYTHSELPPAEPFYLKPVMYWIPDLPGDMYASSLSLRMILKKCNRSGLNNFHTKWDPALTSSRHFPEQRKIPLLPPDTTTPKHWMSATFCNQYSNFHTPSFSWPWLALWPNYLQTTQHYHYKELRAFQQSSTMFFLPTKLSMTPQQDLPEPNPTTKVRTKAQVRVSRQVRRPPTKAIGTTTKNGTHSLRNTKATTQTDPQTKPNMAEIGMTTTTLQAHQGCHPHLLHNLPESKPTPKQHLLPPSGMFTTPDTNLPLHPQPQPQTTIFAFNAVASKAPTMIAQIVIHIHYHQASPTRFHKSHLHLGALELTPTMTHVRPSLAMENVNYANTIRTLSSSRRTSIRPFCQALLTGVLHYSWITSFIHSISTRTRTSSTTSTFPRPNYPFRATTLYYLTNSQLMIGLTMWLHFHWLTPEFRTLSHFHMIPNCPSKYQILREMRLKFSTQDTRSASQKYNNISQSWTGLPTTSIHWSETTTTTIRTVGISTSPSKSKRNLPK